MRYKITIAIYLLIAAQSFGQSTNVSTLFQNDLKKGEQFYNVLAYRNALELFLYYEEKHPNEVGVKEKIADCYVKLGNYREASKWYSKIVDDPKAKPIALYQYAQVLSILKQYDQALKAYQRYLISPETDVRAKLKIAFLDLLDYHMRDSNLYTVNHEWYNSDQSDFAPSYYQDGVVFVSARDRDLFVKRKSVSALNEDETPLNTFFAPKTVDEERSIEDQVVLFYKKDLSSIYHDGPVTFYGNGKKIAFSRNTLRNGIPTRDSKGKVNLELFFASLREDNTLSNVNAFPYNDGSHSTGHPWLSNDGNVLLFASDRPGGMGGADIYKSTFENGKWTEPKNLGQTINTPGDEFYPHLFKDSVLFFASNGHGGFGGLDNFASRIENGSFTTPSNLSYPINTSMDDFALVVDQTGRNGLFSSNREGGKGYDDIYSFTLNKFTLLGTVVERASKQPIDKATVFIRNPDNSIVDSLVTDGSGNFYKQLPLDKEYKVNAKKDGYTSIDEITFRSDKNSVLADTLTIPIWENGLFAQGYIYSNELQSILPDAVVTLKNLTTGAIDSLNIGKNAFYKFLVLPNMKYTITAQKEGHIEKGFNLNTEGLFKGNLVNDILLEETFLEKLQVLFDFDESIIKSEFFATLDKFVKDLKRAPASTVNIGAHADSKGTREYNLSLSNRRAAAVVNYLTERGISKSRIEAIGFGEELILNRCSDGVECTDEEHSLNRRAEIKIQMQN